MIAPLDPGGRGVDILRSCYRVKWKLFRDSDTLYPVEWFFTETDKTLPFPTSYNTNRYDDPRANKPVGPQKSPRPKFLDGVPPPGRFGQAIMGTPEQFLTGAKTTDALPPRQTTNCVPSPIVHSAGGLLLATKGIGRRLPTVQAGQLLGLQVHACNLINFAGYTDVCSKAMATSVAGGVHCITPGTELPLVWDPTIPAFVSGAPTDPLWVQWDSMGLPSHQSRITWRCPLFGTHYSLVAFTGAHPIFAEGVTISPGCCGGHNEAFGWHCQTEV